MTAVITVNHDQHRKTHAAAIANGFKKHGLKPVLIQRDTFAKGDVIVIWGWNQQNTVKAAKSKGVPVLVMERGYLPNRMEWSSLAWGGLNGRGRFPGCMDRGERFQSNWGQLLKPWRASGEYVLLCGQVAGDASVRGLNVNTFNQDVTNQLLALGEKVVFRPHPVSVARRLVKCPNGAKLSEGKPLQADFAGAKAVVVYNSNSAVESVLEGIPTIAMDEGSMAWPVAGHSLEDRQRPERDAWANKMAWTQWTMDEIHSGQAWEVIRQVA